MLNNVTGPLIEMNVHMMTTSLANVLIALGGVLVAVSAAAAIVILVLKRVLQKGEGAKNVIKPIVVYLILACIGVFMLAYGVRIPRDKIISYCANGPVSIEEISTRYDIVEIDGKLIRLKERR